jgi:hypothetical protein
VELASIGERFAGRGPSFYNQSDEFAAYFLRRADAADVVHNPPRARAGLPLRTPGQSRLPWDPDEVALSSLQGFKLLVLGRSPRVSRPPASYRLAYRGRFYEVWQREPAPTVLAHVALGTQLQASSVPSCALVQSVAARAVRDHARLAYLARRPDAALVPTRAQRPPDWGEVEGEPFSLDPRQQRGSVIGTISVPSAGRYQLWLQGSFGQRIHVSIAGRRAGSVSYELGPPGQFVQLGAASLPAGPVQATVTWPASGISPGEEAGNHLLGPLMLVASAERPQVARLAPASARELCGRSLDWIEVVR